LIGEREKDLMCRIPMETLQGRQATDQLGCLSPLIDCGSGGWGAKVVTKRCQKG